MRDGARRPGTSLWLVVALGVGAAFVAGPLVSQAPAAGKAAALSPVARHAPVAGVPGAAVARNGAASAGGPGAGVASGGAASGGAASGGAASGGAASGGAASGGAASGGVSVDAVFAPALTGEHSASLPIAVGAQAPVRNGAASRAVQVARTTAARTPAVAPLRRLRPADLLIVAPAALRPSLAAAIRRLPGVTATQRVDAATIKVNGKFIQMLGVDPGSFRAFAARPTARSTALWRSIASGNIAVSYTMGKQGKLPLGSHVHVAGKRLETLRVGGYGTVGIGGVDAVVSRAVAATLGLPSGNALVISAPHARLAALMSRIKRLLPRRVAIAQLVAQAQPGVFLPAGAVGNGAAGATSAVTGAGAPITSTRVLAFLKAALSRVGMPYVWGAAGPRSFDCSGLVQWSMSQAGIVMPRVAADQARTGPRVPISALRPGDLLFYHTDPTAPTYISHVAIYLGNGLMLQAPEPGMDVQVVAAILDGPGFAGAVDVYPGLAAAVAASPVG